MSSISNCFINLLVIISIASGICPYEDADLSHNNNGKILPAINWEDCADYCRAQEDFTCVGWVYNSVTEFCYPKNNWFSGDITYAIGHYSGSVLCQRGEETVFPTCVEKDKDYWGNDIGVVFTTNISECIEICKINSQTTKDCEGFTFDSLRGLCYLKNNLADPHHAKNFFSAPISNCN
eukprot:16766_1